MQRERKREREREPANCQRGREREGERGREREGERGREREKGKRRGREEEGTHINGRLEIALQVDQQVWHRVTRVLCQQRGSVC